MQNLQAKVRLRSEGSLSDPSVFFFFFTPSPSHFSSTNDPGTLFPRSCRSMRKRISFLQPRKSWSRPKQTPKPCTTRKAKSECVWVGGGFGKRLQYHLSGLNHSSVSFLSWFFFSFLMFSFSFFLTYLLSCLRSHLLTLSFLIFLFLPYLCSFLLIFYLLLALFFISYFLTLALFLSCLVSRLFFLIYLFSFPFFFLSFFLVFFLSIFLFLFLFPFSLCCFISLVISSFLTCLKDFIM